jgi:hypothetical protein
MNNDKYNLNLNEKERLFLIKCLCYYKCASGKDVDKVNEMATKLENLELDMMLIENSNKWRKQQ